MHDPSGRTNPRELGGAGRIGSGSDLRRHRRHRGQSQASVQTPSKLRTLATGQQRVARKVPSASRAQTVQARCRLFQTSVARRLSSQRARVLKRRHRPHRERAPINTRLRCLRTAFRERTEDARVAGRAGLSTRPTSAIVHRVSVCSGRLRPSPRRPLRVARRQSARHRPRACSTSGQRWASRGCSRSSRTRRASLTCATTRARRSPSTVLTRA